MSLFCNAGFGMLWRNFFFVQMWSDGTTLLPDIFTTRLAFVLLRCLILLVTRYWLASMLIRPNLSQVLKPALPMRLESLAWTSYLKTLCLRILRQLAVLA